MGSEHGVAPWRASGLGFETTTVSSRSRSKPSGRFARTSTLSSRTFVRFATSATCAASTSELRGDPTAAWSATLNSAAEMASSKAAEPISRPSTATRRLSPSRADDWNVASDWDGADVTCARASAHAVRTSSE